jgi:DNA-binding response OmpR family regulator
MRVLVAEDEPRVAEAVARGLRREGAAVDVALDGRSALAKARAFDYDVARIRALARRAHTTRPAVLERSGVRLDPSRHEVSRDGRAVELAPKEFAVLEALLEADGDVVSARRLLDRVWDENIDTLSNTVRMTVMTLRKKLGQPAVIETVRGAGYRI